MPRVAPPGPIPLALAVLATLVLAPVAARAADPATRVFLNGTPAPVYFNDGDSFRVLTGEFEGTKARLAGFNTLESFGAVHWWPGWTEQELYHLAKMGMLNARKGVWHCTSDLKRDGYGRMLWWCPDLAVDQIRKGYAHALSVTEEPADPELLKAQWEAIRARRGIWSHGVPEYVLTSLHSMSEDPTRPQHYNRIVSPLDGHSEPWSHAETYGECQKVCYRTTRVAAAARTDAIGRLRSDPAAGPALKGFDDALVGLLVSAYVRSGHVSAIVPAEPRDAIDAVLKAMVLDGALKETETLDATCHLYIDFKRRFGMQRAACLVH